MRGRAWLSGPALPLLGAAVGLLVGLAVTLLVDSTYRADASIVLVRQGQPPGSDPQLAQAAEAAAELFDSRAVAESAIRNLGLDESPRELLDRVDVEAEEGSSLVRIEVEAPSKEEARRAAQEVAEVATVLFNDRFSPPTTAAVWEPAVPMSERVTPKPARNLALGLLIGALAGLAFVLVGGGRQRLPRPPGKPAFAPNPAATPVAHPELGSVRAPPPSESERYSEPGSGEWTLGDVERLVADHGHEFPELEEEFGFYLESLRGLAGPEERLPPGVQGVIEDVFREPILRARRAGSDSQSERGVAEP